MKMQGNRTIFVVESGWVFQCESWQLEGSEYYLNEASVIRVWGTTDGLGQIALKGPTSETVYDFCGNPNVPYSKVLFVLPCTFTPAIKK